MYLLTFRIRIILP